MPIPPPLSWTKAITFIKEYYLRRDNITHWALWSLDGQSPLSFPNPRIHRINFRPRPANRPLFGNLFWLSNIVGGVGGITTNQPNKWLAVAAVWTFVLSPEVIFTYSEGISQATIACLLVWTLALALGEKRSIWELTLSGFLAGATIMTRQNMVPVLPLLVTIHFLATRMETGDVFLVGRRRAINIFPYSLLAVYYATLVDMAAKKFAIVFSRLQISVWFNF